MQIEVDEEEDCCRDGRAHVERAALGRTGQEAVQPEPGDEQNAPGTPKGEDAEGVDEAACGLFSAHHGLEKAAVQPNVPRQDKDE
jgi:hypothetical protein